MKVFKFPKKLNIIPLLIFILSISLFSSISFAQDDTSDSNYHTKGWVNQSSSWTEQGCTINVYNQRSGKWCAGIYNRLWPDYVSNKDDTNDNGQYWKIGDKVTVYANTQYIYSWVRVYANGLLVYDSVEHETENEYHYLENRTFEYTITDLETKFVCTAGGGAAGNRYEQLGVTIIATGDTVKPTVECNATVVVNKNINITLKDNVGVVGYIITKDSVAPTENSSWTNISSGTNRSVSYTPTQDGTYYVWAIDAGKNISDRKSFEAGYLPVLSGPNNISIKEGGTPTFTVGLSSGTTPINSYQWYEASSAGGNGTAINGATNSTYAINNVNRNKNGKYYYCIAENRFGKSSKTVGALLTVWYPHQLNNVADVDVNLSNSSVKFTTSIRSQGNTKNYRYQWYRSNSSSPTAPGVKIEGANSNTYQFSPEYNIFNEYYYCVVTNYNGDENLYEVSTNRARLRADVRVPTITMGKITLNPTNTEHNSKTYINSSYTLKVPFTVLDKDGDYVENGKNLTADDIKVMVAGNEKDCNKSLTYRKINDQEVNYELTVSNIPDDGSLTFEIEAGNSRSEMPTVGFKDSLGNANRFQRFNTSYIIDNTKPYLKQQSYVSGANERYLNKDKTLVIKIALVEATGLNPDDLTVDDLIIKIGDSVVDSGVIKTMSYSGRTGDMYIYDLSLKNLISTSDGVLKIGIADNTIYDWATNGNGSTESEFEVHLDDNMTSIIVDNTPPILSSIRAEFDSYGSNTLYPNSLASWHDNWSKKDIYITINASDGNGISHYETSKNLGNSYTRLSVENNKPGRELLTEDFNNYVYYRVVDKAGNVSQNIENSSNAYRVMIKIDKKNPEPAKLGMYELRLNGVEYTFSEEKPSNRNIVVKPTNLNDVGTVRSEVICDSIGGTPSGMETSPALEYSSNASGTYASYYTVTHYDVNNRSSQKDTPKTYRLDEQAETLIDDGWYEIKLVTTDRAGNYVISNATVYINKRQSNVIRINNINDVGSGVKKIVINAYNSDQYRNQGTRAIDEIVVDNPGKSYQTTLKLGRGYYLITLDIEDKTIGENGPNKVHYDKLIYNEF